MEEKRRIYYVDDIGGNDAESGLTPQSAWKSLERVNAQTFLPGDVLRFRRGGKWHGMLYPSGSGSAQAPIVAEAYGEGERPVIHGDGSYAAVYLEGLSFWTVRDIAVTNRATERGIRQGICICGSPVGITQGIRVENCEVSEVYGENRRELGAYRSMYWNSGIYVTMAGRASAQNHLHDIFIIGNDIHDVYTSGIRVNQVEDFITDIHHTHVVIRGNRIERTGSDGIIVANCISPLIEGNCCLDAGALGNKEETRLIAGVWVCATQDALIQRNEVGSTRLFQNDGTAFDTDWGTAGTTIFQYNYTHDNQGGFWLDCMGINRNRECQGTILRYNISVNDARCLIQDDYGIEAELYGNLFLQTGEGSGPQICCHQTGASHLFRKNIFAFRGLPEKGWQSSCYQGNWYAALKEWPKEDVSGQPGMPFSAKAAAEAEMDGGPADAACLDAAAREGLAERLNQSDEERRRMWDMLTQAVGTRALAERRNG